MTTTRTLFHELSLSNYFFIDMQTNETTKRSIAYKTKNNWVNPYSHSTIKPYVPGDSQEFVKICEDAYTKYSQTLNYNNTGTPVYEAKDPFVIIFAHLDPKNLANFSEVSKCCYLATKPPIIWKSQMTKLLPNVKILPTQLCQFSTEQQFKIIFKRISDELKPYICKLKRNYEVLSELRGPNGMHGTINAAWKDFVQKAGPKTAQWKQYPKPFLSKEDYAADVAHQKYNALNHQLTWLVGQGYDGAVGSIGRQNEQAMLQNAIDFGVRHAFNNQDMFEKVIRTSEAQQTFKT